MRVLRVVGIATLIFVALVALALNLRLLFSPETLLGAEPDVEVFPSSLASAAAENTYDATVVDVARRAAARAHAAHVLDSPVSSPVFRKAKRAATRGSVASKGAEATGASEGGASNGDTPVAAKESNGKQRRSASTQQDSKAGASLRTHVTPLFKSPIAATTNRQGDQGDAQISKQEAQEEMIENEVFRDLLIDAFYEALPEWEREDAAIAASATNGKASGRAGGGPAGRFITNRTLLSSDAPWTVYELEQTYGSDADLTPREVRQLYTHVLVGGHMPAWIQQRLAFAARRVDAAVAAVSNVAARRAAAAASSMAGVTSGGGNNDQANHHFFRSLAAAVSGTEDAVTASSGTAIDISHRRMAAMIRGAMWHRAGVELAQSCSQARWAARIYTRTRDARSRLIARDSLGLRDAILFGLARGNGRDSIACLLQDERYACPSFEAQLTAKLHDPWAVLRSCVKTNRAVDVAAGAAERSPDVLAAVFRKQRLANARAVRAAAFEDALAYKAAEAEAEESGEDDFDDEVDGPPAAGSRAAAGAAATAADL